MRGLFWAFVALAACGTVPTDDGVETDSDELLTGDLLYALHCARCHGGDGAGTDNGPALEGELSKSDQELIDVMLNGDGDMPAADVNAEEGGLIVAWMRANL